MLNSCKHHQVPGSDDLLQADNTVVRIWGDRREEADLFNHVDLVEMLDIVDLDKGVAIAGQQPLLPVERRESLSISNDLQMESITGKIHQYGYWH